MIAVQDKAEAATRIVNDAIAVDGDPFTLALMLAHVGARVVQSSCSNSDVLAYSVHMLDLVARLQRGEVVR